MNTAILKTGLRRGRAEYLQFARDRRELLTGPVGATVSLVALVAWQGHGTVPGTGASKAVLMTAGFVAYCVFSTALMNLALGITADREEGALLRLRTLPGGMTAYLVGRTVSVLGQIATYVALMLAAGLAFTELTLPTAPGDWLTLAWVLALGTLSVAPIGAALGAVVRDARNAAAALSLAMMGLMIISGVLFPITAMPQPVQWVAQAFPLYWQGLGLRSVFLPDSMLAAEIGGSWRLWEAAGVMSAWAAAGLLVAPWLLQRMTRRESGSRLAERRRRHAVRRAY
ncbi:ABC transporter permease [Spirillospora sp. CA-253888]